MNYDDDHGYDDDENCIYDDAGDDEEICVDDDGGDEKEEEQCSGW